MFSIKTHHHYIHLLSSSWQTATAVTIQLIDNSKCRFLKNKTVIKTQSIQTR